MIDQMKLSKARITIFQTMILDFYRQHGRIFPWRHVDDPYCIVVSEIMLQQTQTYRVEPKYEQFIATFPDFESLASASLKDVLSAWQGLGYNRRGKFLHELAQIIVREHGGQVPQSPEILQTLPGIGKATAASICAFAFNMPVVFIETNIRAVFIETFFRGQDGISDAQLMPLIEQAMDYKNPRDWYYALMDYGVMLKKMTVNPSRRSAHHTVQSKFEGSDRQIRGMIVRALTQYAVLSRDELLCRTARDEVRVDTILNQLIAEAFIVLTPDGYTIP